MSLLPEPTSGPTGQSPEVLNPEEPRLPRAVVITQSAQNDFMRRLQESEPLPNLVHIGRMEAERLMGKSGAFPRFMEEVHALDPQDVMIIHLVDSHDWQEHQAHYKRFKPHAEKGTEGAALVSPIQEIAARRPNTIVLPGGDLNDFQDSRLLEVLRDRFGGRDFSAVKFAIVGVWTDVKVSFNCYDLVTRLKADQVATCSALTASRSLQDHHQALQALSGVLGIQVFHSPLSLLEWLAPGEISGFCLDGCASPVPTANLVDPFKWGEKEKKERDVLLSELLGDAKQLTIRQLGGGYSGAQVLLVEDEIGVSVIKIGERNEVARERYGNEQIARVLHKKAPRVLGVTEGDKLGAMKIALAGESTGSIETLQGLAQSNRPEVTNSMLKGVLEDALDRGMGRLYRVAQKDNTDLLEAYGFTDGHGNVPFGDSVIARAHALAIDCGFTSVRSLLEDAKIAKSCMEPEEFYKSWLPGRTMVREVYNSIIHGDLNLQNILVDGWSTKAAASSWLIDFARLARLPVLTDFAKLENDLSYILLPVDNELGLERVRKIQDLRLRTRTLELSKMPEGLIQTPQETRYYEMLKTVRLIAAEMDDRGSQAMEDYRLALMRFSAHTMSFPEPNLYQRRLALEGTAQLAKAIAENAMKIPAMDNKLSS